MGNCKCCDSQAKENNEFVLNNIPTTPKIAQNTSKNKNYVKFEDSSKAKGTVQYDEKVNDHFDHDIVPNYVSSPIVFDNGNLNTRIGYSQEDNPKFIFPTIMGTSERNEEQKFIGLQATEHKTEILRLKNPLERGSINDWNTMESIWEYSIDMLGYSKADDTRCLLTEVVDNNSEKRMKTCEYFFEKFGVAKFLLMNESLLSLYHSAKTSGVVVDSGHSSTYIVPIYEGYSLHSHVQKLKLSGYDIHNHLLQSLNQISRKFTTRKEVSIADDIIRNHCYFATNYEQENLKMNNLKNHVVFKLPDGENINLGEELFQCTEILFNPKIIGNKSDGVHIQLDNAFNILDNDLIPLFLKNIVFSGGSTLIKGFVERLKVELQKNKRIQKSLMSYNEKNINSAWIGGSLVSNLSSFQSEFIDKKEYEEYGSIIIQRKCFY